MILHLILIILTLFVMLSAVAVIILGVGKIIDYTIKHKRSGYLMAFVIVAWLAASIPICFIGAGSIVHCLWLFA